VKNLNSILTRYKNIETTKKNYWIGTLLIGQCNLKEFILFFLPQRKDKRSPTTQNNTFANRDKPTLQSKFAKELFFSRCALINIQYFDTKHFTGERLITS
jgi:hypothetical protein